MKMLDKIKKSPLQVKLLLVILSLVLLLVLAFSFFTVSVLGTSLKEQIGSRALQVSLTVANSPGVIENIKARNQPWLQDFAETVRIKTGASFVVIGDSQGVRLAHPRPDRIGKKMVGGDNERALVHGESYISQARGSLGVSLRGKTAIFDNSGNIVGVVSVGYLLTEIDGIIHNYRVNFLWFVLLLIALGSLLAILIAKSFKRAIFGLEPEQIADLLVQKQATLEAVREGIIAINTQGCITTINQAAIDSLGLNQERDYIDTPLRNVLPNSGLVRVLEKQTPMLDVEFNFNDRRFIGNRLPVFAGDRLVGAVSSFRSQDEIDQLSESLNKLQEYAELLRVQTHEYANRLHTISGLIQLDAKDEALDLIFSETSGYQDLIQFLASAVPNPVVAGMMIGKYNRARELGAEMDIDRESSLRELPDSIDARDVVTIVGNVIDNALEAAISAKSAKAKIGVSFTDIGNDLIFEVEDNGPGLTEQQLDRMLEDGVTSKSSYGHGIGLGLVKRTLERLGGEISVHSTTEEETVTDSLRSRGTIMCIYIPKSASAIRSSHD